MISCCWKCEALRNLAAWDGLLLLKVWGPRQLGYMRLFAVVVESVRPRSNWLHEMIYCCWKCTATWLHEMIYCCWKCKATCHMRWFTVESVRSQATWLHEMIYCCWKCEVPGNLATWDDLLLLLKVWVPRQLGCMRLTIYILGRSTANLALI